MGQKLLYIVFAVIIIAVVLTGAFYLLRRVFPKQLEGIPIFGVNSNSSTSILSPLTEPDKKEASNTSGEQSPAPQENRQAEASNPTPVPTPAPASPKAETSPKVNTTASGKTTYIVQPSPTPTAFKVTNLTINSSPASYSGSCPKDVTFYATITTNGAGSVNYRFIRSDGTETGENSISFDFASSKSVENTWSRSSSGWERLKITSPNALESSQATFNISCN